MKTKLLKALSFLLVVCMMIPMLVACDGSDPKTECDHDWDDWTVVKEATCTSQGKQTRICGKCDKVQEKDIYALDHRYQDGVCTVCGELDADYPTELPTTPDKPEDPTEPPTDPDEPEDPTEPPTDPDEPEDPTEPPTDPDEPEDPTEPPINPDVPDAPGVDEAEDLNVSGNKYNGTTFTIYSVEDMFPKKYFYADKTTGDSMNDALYQRQKSVEQLLDVQLVYRPAEASGNSPAYQMYATEIKNSMRAGTEKYQLVLSHTYYAIPDLIAFGGFYDFNNFTNIDYTKPYWNKKIMDQVDYKGHYYLGYSDLNLASTYVVAFNKSLYNNYIAAFGGNTMYDYVKNNEWTISQMADVSTYVYEDKGGVDYNTYGLTGQLWVPFCGFIQSSGESIVAKNQGSGQYEVTFMADANVNRKLGKLVARLQDLQDFKETYFYLHEAFNPNTKPLTLETGRVFMELRSTSSLVDLVSSNIKFGVLPYPMYDTAQAQGDENNPAVGYRSLSWAGYLCVPANISNANMVGDVIEALSYYSDDVTTNYYEKLLGLKVSEAPEDAEMLNIIWDSLCADFGVTYECMDSACTFDAFVYAVPRVMIGYYSSFAALRSSYGRAAVNVLNKTMNNN